jgi:hypothetical protein
MSRPRQIFAGSFYLLTRRCTQRQFLLKPDEITNNAFLYCLIEAAQRYGIDVLLPTAEANHHHTVIYDRDGRAPQFVEHFHKMVARCMNARWGRCENFWAAEEVCLTRLLTREAVVDKLVYTAGNPVKDHLVDKAIHWPGVSGYHNLLTGSPLRAVRPSHFFRDDGAMPAVVELPLVIPPELGPREVVIAEVKAGIEALEKSVRSARIASGKRVIGKKQICAQSWKNSPASREPRGGLRPRFAGAGPARVVALAEYRQFLVDYAAARRIWQTGASTVFPAGTYWLARHAAISVAPARPIVLG